MGNQINKINVSIDLTRRIDLMTVELSERNTEFRLPSLRSFRMHVSLALRLQDLYIIIFTLQLAGPTRYTLKVRVSKVSYVNCRVQRTRKWGVQ